MSSSTGLGMLDVAILEACEVAGAVVGRPFVKSQRVLDVVLERTGIGPRTAYEPLCDLARPWVVHLRLIDFHGNLGSPTGFDPANPRYTECRLTPLGAAALASERGRLGPLPVGLINGNTHVHGGQAPLDPGRVCEAIRVSHTVTDDALVAIVGGPTFPMGCDVQGDLEGWAAGTETELRLSARIEQESTDRLVISHLPPDCTTSEIAEAIESHVNRARQGPQIGVEQGEAGGRRPAPPIRDVNDESTDTRARLVIDLAHGADPDDARRFLETLWGVRRTMVTHISTPISDLVREIGLPDRPDLTERLTLITSAISS